MVIDGVREGEVEAEAVGANAAHVFVHSRTGLLAVVKGKEFFSSLWPKSRHDLVVFREDMQWNSLRLDKQRVLGHENLAVCYIFFSVHRLSAILSFPNLDGIHYWGVKKGGPKVEAGMLTEAHAIGTPGDDRDLALFLSETDQPHGVINAV